MPMENQDLEVDLNYITSCEQMSRSRSEYDYRMEYESLVTSMLGHEGIYLFEQDITDQYNNLSLKEILEQNDKYVQGPNKRNPKMDGKLCPTYYDTCMSLYITPANRSYPSFLAYLLKNIDLLKIDQCLAYQLEKYHANDFASFSRLLSLIIRKYEGVIIPEKVLTTIQEWITSRSENQKNEQADAKDSAIGGKKRGRINRRAEDNITVLNREQTILLIQYLKESGVFLKDEYLTDADAGKAFELLTGYSQNTIRQDLGKFYQFQNKENLKKLHQTFSQLIRQIETLMK